MYPKNGEGEFGKENQYEFECGVCAARAYGHKGRCVCDACKALTESFRVIFRELREKTHSQTSDAELAITAMHRAVKTERERCAEIAEDWLEISGAEKPQFITPQNWAADAVRDIADAIRNPQQA